MTASVLGEALAEAFRPIGLALYEYSDMSSIVEDMVSGVRAHLDPTLSGGALTGLVPSEWRNNPTIVELSQNMVFVRAALQIPPGSSVAPMSEGWKLEKWSSRVLAAIKSSERYAWVSKSEIQRTYGLRKIRDVKGRVKSAVLYRSAKVQPIAQAVFAIPDSILEGGYSIHATNDRIADAIQSAYGSATFDLASSANMLGDLLMDGIEAGWTGHREVYAVDLLEEGVDLTTIACMMSERLFVHASKKGIELVAADPEMDRVEWQPKWWFTVPTKEQDLDVMSGSHLRSEIVTSDPVEVLLAHEEFVPQESVAVKPQVLGPAAFGSTVVAFDARILKSVGSRYSFDISINNVKMRGAFKPSSFASMRSRDMTSLVSPHFNLSVIEGYATAYQAADSVLAAMATTRENEDGQLVGWENGQVPAEEFFSFMRRRIARSLLMMAQELSPAFRQEVHDAVVSRSVAQETLSQDDALVLRAKLSQRTFAAASDMIALDFFLDTQGVNVEVWREMLSDPEMIKVWMEMGSDREVGSI
jgi:hypothetical protein